MIAERPHSIAVVGGPSLEGALAVPPAARAGVVVCHPHPLYGGDMDNPVVLAATQACTEAGLATLRFNFRGVGDSSGAWDEGRGEQDDVRAALTCLGQALPAPARLAVAGYSFGAAMAASVASAGLPLAGLALIAPPLSMRPWQPTPALAVDGRILLVAGRADHYCSPGALAQLGHALPKATVILFDGVDHFFLAGLDRLAAAVRDWAAAIS